MFLVVCGLVSSVRAVNGGWLLFRRIPNPRRRSHGNQHGFNPRSSCICKGSFTAVMRTSSLVLYVQALSFFYDLEIGG